jgi:integrase
MTMADKRRGNQEGTVYKRADGRYEAKVTLPDGKRKSFYRKTRQEASAALTKALGAVAGGLPVSPEKQTVGVYLTKWLEASAHSLKPRTVTAYRNAIVHHIAPALGRYRLARLGPQEVRSFYAKELAAGASASAVRGMHTVLRRALGQAAEDGLVPRNVAAIAKAPRATRHTEGVACAGAGRGQAFPVGGRGRPVGGAVRAGAPYRHSDRRIDWPALG